MDGSEHMEPLIEARRLADDLASSLPQSIPIAALPYQSKIPFKVFSLRETLLHRASALASPAVTLLEAGNIVGGALLARAVIETAAVLFELQSKLDAFVKTPDAEVLDTFLMKGLFANRREEGGVKNAYYTSSILSSVDRLDKKSKGFRKTYDILSEFVHPNYDGVFGSFGAVDKENFILNLGPKNDTMTASNCAKALVAALEILFAYYNDMAEVLTALNQHFEPGWCEGPADGGS
ncbi:MAG: hypothetical protein V4631_15095 [Pseudomonadota bacterium]